MKELRLLILRSVPTSQEVEYLSNELSYLEWYKCPCRTFPSNFQPDKLVQLHMQHSSIEQLWKRSMKPIKLLKVIDLSYSESLIETPDFRGIPNLEELNLEGCKNLHEVHRSIGVLKRLVFLNLKNCGNLVSLPSSMCNLKSLKSLILRGCSKLKKLPNMLDMNCLEVLDAAGIGMQQLELAKQWNFHLLSWLMPSTWKNPEPMVMAFPSALPFLKELDLSYCNLPEGAIPNDLSGFPLLERLNLSGNNFMTLPSSINHLSQLHCLELSNCKKLQSLPDLPSNIVGLYVENCTSLESLPNLSDKPNVKHFRIDFSYCSKLNDKQGTIKVAFAWLKSFLLSFLKIRRLLRIQEICTNMDQFEKICRKKGIYTYRPYSFPRFSMYLPGSEIADWFNYQSFNSPLKIYLSSSEKWWNIVGFVVCVVITEDDEPTCEFEVYSKNKFVFGPTYHLKDWRSDHLYLFFIPNHLIDPYEEQSPTKVKLTFNETEIKKCGIRIVHEKEIEELLQLGKPLENLYAFQNFEEIYSPSHEENFDSGEEVSTELEFWSEGEADDMELGICCSEREEDDVEWEISSS
ncbi:LOW QUALITY PROTEIN: disease resistance protein RPS4 [Jatropha curcas]|uniref:LOW QUALITY PROTEIN: disease resistance protein RPS4 n=1 Tax=Jatropha curcas TaxID=180498 RepID=UPI0018953B63|nr:LOW QUALITY PROTEIN: disease resistance protein RPS4 [Jatropha curcas]